MNVRRTWGLRRVRKARLRRGFPAGDHVRFPERRKVACAPSSLLPIALPRIVIMGGGCCPVAGVTVGPFLKACRCRIEQGGSALLQAIDGKTALDAALSIETERAGGPGKA